MYCVEIETKSRFIYSPLIHIYNFEPIEIVSHFLFLLWFSKINFGRWSVWIMQIAPKVVSQTKFTNRSTIWTKSNKNHKNTITTTHITDTIRFHNHVSKSVSNRLNLNEGEREREKNNTNDIRENVVNRYSTTNLKQHCNYLNKFQTSTVKSRHFVEFVYYLSISFFRGQTFHNLQFYKLIRPFALDDDDSFTTGYKNHTTNNFTLWLVSVASVIYYLIEMHQLKCFYSLIRFVSYE